MIYSPYLIAQSERHFARLIRMNFMIYNLNFAHQTRQRVIWKTLKYPPDKEDHRGPNSSNEMSNNNTDIHQGPVPKRPSSVNAGLKFCSVFVFYIPTRV